MACLFRQRKTRRVRHTFYLSGDLSQMSAQGRFLRGRGFSVEQNNVYPCVTPEDKQAALQAIWDARCDGWWHYQREYVELGICTAEEFKEALDIRCARSRSGRE